MFKLSDYVKPVEAMEEIETIGFDKLCKITKATDFKPSDSPKYGRRVHVMQGATRLFAIKLGKSVDLNGKDFKSLDGLKELINNHDIYHGIATVDYLTKETLDKPRSWVAFGKKGELSEGVSYSLDEIMAAMGTT